MQTTPTEGGQVTLAVEGMSCGGCANAVENAIREIPGVEAATVDLEAGRALIIGTGLNPARLVEAVEEAGFTAKPE